MKQSGTPIVFARPLDALRQVFGFDCFRGRQEAIIHHLLAGKHAMVVMPTGMGKSICYQLPALMMADPRELVLVISPLIALMKDQVDSLLRRGIEATYVNSSLDRQTREIRYAEIPIATSSYWRSMRLIASVSGGMIFDPTTRVWRRFASRSLSPRPSR